MDSHQRVIDQFQQSAEVIRASVDIIGADIARAAGCMVQALLSENKILACGNGGSATDAQHFSAEMLNRFMRERPPLPGIALTPDCATLTAISNDYEFDQIFAKQIMAMGKAGDVLLAITTSGNSANVLRAIEVAHERQLICIALTGNDGGKIAGMLADDDIEIRVPHDSTPRIQEVHGITIHCLCDLIDQLLFGNH